MKKENKGVVEWIDAPVEASNPRRYTGRTKPAHHWSFRALPQDIDIQRILREARAEGADTVRIRVGYEDALLVRAGSPDHALLADIQVPVDVADQTDRIQFQGEYIMVLRGKQSPVTEWFIYRGDIPTLIERLRKARAAKNTIRTVVELI